MLPSAPIPPRIRGVTRPTRRDKGLSASSVIAGLHMEPELATALSDQAREHAAANGLKTVNVAAFSRHLLRMGLGWTTDDSLAVEKRFAEIAIKRRKLAESY